MPFEALIADGWRRHDAEAQQVHQALAEAVDLVRSDDQLRAFCRLLTHLHAEHLDDRRAGRSLLEALRARFEVAPSPAYRPATAGIEVLRFLDGNPAGLAQLSREERAGEQERAYYRCARSRLHANRPQDAIECADQCLQLCERNDAPACERFFACAVGALAYRAAGDIESFRRWFASALSHYEALDSTERAACEGELAELQAP